MSGAERGLLGQDDTLRGRVRGLNLILRAVRA